MPQAKTISVADLVADPIKSNPDDAGYHDSATALDRVISTIDPACNGKQVDLGMTNRPALQVLSELLMQIRGIAGDASGLGHVSTMGRGHFTQETALKAIYDLADAAHSIPEAIADAPGGAGFLLSGSLEQVASIGARLFGDRSRL